MLPVARALGRERRLSVVPVYCIAIVDSSRFKVRTVQGSSRPLPGSCGLAQSRRTVYLEWLLVLTVGRVTPPNLPSRCDAHSHSGHLRAATGTP